MGNVVYLSGHRNMTERERYLYDEAVRDLYNNQRSIEEVIKDLKKKKYPQIVIDEIFRGDGGRNEELFLLMKIFG